MLHADLHFGNLLWQKDGIGIIDFDDSGFGFRMYDLAVTSWMINRNRKIPYSNKLRLKQALLEGYATVIPIDSHDSKLLNTLITTRELVLLGWLLRRQDNPKLRPFMGKALQRNRQTLKRVVGSL
jgi:Ser/Thr protein kinase RdoA (MazF antagonist)